MNKVTLNGIIKSFIVTGFTLTAALIWRDILAEIINIFTPTQHILLYKILTTMVITIALIILIYLILKTEEETEHILYKFNHNGKNKQIRTTPK